MAALRTFTTGLSLLLLFGVCMFMFMTYFINANNPDSIALSEGNMNATTQKLVDSASSLQQESENAKDLLTNFQPSPVYLFLIIYSAFAIPLVLN